MTVVRYFANQTSEANDTCSQALYIKKEWNSLGLENVQLKRYEVLLRRPKRPSVLTLTDGNGTKVYSSILKTLTGAGNDLKSTFPFSAHSASGVVTGKLVYVNYGRDSDFKYLDASNVSCTGKIVIARYGRILEENKVKAGCLFFSCQHILFSFDRNTTEGSKFTFQALFLKKCSKLTSFTGFNFKQPF